MTWKYITIISLWQLVWIFVRLQITYLLISCKSTECIFCNFKALVFVPNIFVLANYVYTGRWQIDDVVLWHSNWYLSKKYRKYEQIIMAGITTVLNDSSHVLVVERFMFCKDKVFFVSLSWIVLLWLKLIITSRINVDTKWRHLSLYVS